MRDRGAHQVVIRRMKCHLVDAMAIRVVRLQFRRVAIREAPVLDQLAARKRGHSARARQCPTHRRMLRRSAAACDRSGKGCSRPAAVPDSSLRAWQTWRTTRASMTPGLSGPDEVAVNTPSTGSDTRDVRSWMAIAIALRLVFAFARIERRGAGRAITAALDRAHAFETVARGLAAPLDPARDFAFVRDCAPHRIGRVRRGSSARALPASSALKCDMSSVINGCVVCGSPPSHGTIAEHRFAGVCPDNGKWSPATQLQRSQAR